MAAQANPPRPWKVDDLLDLGERTGTTYLKAVPVIILERWIQGGREENVANYIKTEELARRLETSGLVSPFKPKGTSNLVGVLVRMQMSRNLTRPPLTSRSKGGWSWVNLPHYEPLLQEYHQQYRKRDPGSYRKLFPDGKPDWEPLGLSRVRTGRGRAEPAVTERELDDEIRDLLAPLEKVLRDLQQARQRLKEENKRLQAELKAQANVATGISFLHTSPYFRGSMYGRTVTSIKDTVGGMLERAEHTIRISTRQMDMFADDLIALKRRSPDMEIIVISCGPQEPEGDRKKLADVAFERMKQAGIKLPIHSDALHSRVVVIDDKEVLVSSADLEFTQMDTKFNAGIWTNNPDVVAEATRFCDNLLGSSQSSASAT
jgi:sugar-specific transcriptional regulator TrmB